MQGLESYEQAAKCEAMSIGSSRRRTLMEELQGRAAGLTSELNKVNDAIKALEAAPEAMALLESLRKVSGLL